MYRQLNSKQRDVMTTILLLANHESNEWEFNGELYRVKPGQFVTSLENLKQYCAFDISIQSIRTALLKLEKHGFLTNESTKRNRLITVVNWGLYQGSDSDDQQTDQQTANKQLTTNKNEENVIKKKDMSAYKEIITYLNQKTGKQFSHKSQANQRLINGRMSEGRTIEDFKQVIDTKCEEWLNDEKMQQYLQPSTLFRPTNFEKYLNQKQRNAPEPKQDFRDKEIAFQKWCEEGNDPNGFDWS